MRKLLVLMRVNFRALLTAFSFGRSKKRAAGGIGALIFMGGLSLYISGVYSFMMQEMLKSVDVLEFYLPIMTLYACAMSLMFTIYAAGGLIFGGKDNDLVLSLPVSAFTVLLARVLALYLENLVFIGLWMIPTSVIYFMTVSPFTMGGLVGVVLICLLLPLFVSLLGLIVGFITVWFSSRAKHKSLFSAIFTFGFFGIFMVLMMQINQLPVFLMENRAAVNHTLHTWLMPFGLMADMMAGSVLGAIGFIALCTVPFFVLVYLMSTRYKRILTNLSTHHTRSDYKLGSIAAQGQFPALLKKEIGRYFGTTIYLFNTGFGMLILPIGTIYACIAKKTADMYLTMMGGMDALLPLILLCIAFILSMTATSCVSISLEGKTLWILKEAPISPTIFFSAKACLNFIVAFPLTALCVLVLGLLYGVSLPLIAAFLLFSAAFSGFVAFSGLVINLFFPKMDAPSDALVVKQSASCMVGLFGNWGIVGLGVGLYALIGSSVGLLVYTLIISAVLLVCDWLLWVYLKTGGAKKLLAL